MTQEGREKNSQYIDHKCRSFLLIILEPLRHKKTGKQIPQEPSDKIGQKNINPETRANTDKNIGGSGKPYCAEMMEISPDHFGTPSKNVRDI